VRDRLRVVVADDERPARSLLLSMLRNFDDVQIVGEAADGAAAVELIEREKPDLALLDLQMPEVDGIGVVRLLKRGSMPMIAFITAYDEYAVRAFEMNAVDYLLKPVDATRLRETVSRAIDRLDRDEFVRLSRGTLANISAIAKAVPMPGGTFVLSLSNGQELQSSRFHSRLLRERLLRL